MSDGFDFCLRERRLCNWIRRCFCGAWRRVARGSYNRWLLAGLRGDCRRWEGVAPDSGRWTPAGGVVFRSGNNTLNNIMCHE